MGNICQDLYGSDVTAYDYYTIAFLLYSALNAATIASNSFMEDRIKAGNMRILYAPICHDWLYISKIIASSLFTFICHMLVAAVCVIIFHIHISNHPVSLIMLLFIAELFSCTLGVFCCLVFHSEQMSNQLLSILINLFAILGGVFFSLDRFGTIARMVSWLSPLKWMLYAAFTCIYDGSVWHVYQMIFVLGLATALLGFLCHHIFNEEACLC